MYRDDRQKYIIFKCEYVPIVYIINVCIQYLGVYALKTSGICSLVIAILITTRRFAIDQWMPKLIFSLL